MFKPVESFRFRGSSSFSEISYKTRHFIQLTSQLTFCLKNLASMCLLRNKMISLLIADVPKKLNIPAVEWAVVLVTRSTNIYKHLLKEILKME